MVDLETFNLLAQIVSVSATATAAIIGVTSYINFNKRAQETRDRELETGQAQLLMQIYDQVNNRDFQRDFSETMWYWKFNEWDDYWEKYGSRIDEYLKLVHVVNTFNGIGTVLENKLVDSKMLYEIVGRSVLQYWDKFGLIRARIPKKMERKRRRLLWRNTRSPNIPVKPPALRRILPNNHIFSLILNIFSLGLKLQ